MAEHEQEERATPAEPYTVHEDADTTTPAEPGDAPAEPGTRSRGGPDPFALVGGLVALVVAGMAATGTLDDVDPRWVLAVAALLVGGTVLVASLRRRA